MSTRVSRFLSGTRYATIGAVALMGLGFTVPALSETLTEATQTAIDTNPLILEATANRRAIKKEFDQAKSRYLPRLDLEAGFGQEYSDNPTTRSRPERLLENEGPGIWDRRTESSLTLTETLFDGFGRERTVDRQRARTEGAAYRVRERAEVLALDVTRAYVDVIRQEELVRLAEMNIENHSTILEDVRERVDAGQAGVGDLQQAEVRHAAARATLTETLRNLDEARIQYRRHVGQAPGDLSEPGFNENTLPTDVDSAVQEGISASPLVKLAQADVSATDADIGIAESSLWPELDAELRGSKNQNLDGIRGSNTDLTAMLRLRYNLYRGGADKHRIQEARERRSQSRATLSRLQRDIEEETRRSWSIMSRQDMETEVRQEQVEANENVVSTYKDEFSVGRRSLLDLLDAQNELFNSQSQLTTSQSNALVARYRVLASMGRLVAVLGVQLPNEAY